MAITAGFRNGHLAISEIITILGPDLSKLQYYSTLHRQKTLHAHSVHILDGTAARSRAFSLVCV